MVYATGDEAWRVREMAARVIALHGLGDALDDVVRLGDHAVARVRTAAERVVEVLTATCA